MYRGKIVKHKTKAITIILLIAYYFCLPKQLFKSPTSTVVTSKDNNLLGAVIANDGQWRFPEIDSIPYKFEQCILQFEDAHFYNHFGFNPISISKALVKNIKARKVVRGGSTITQQVIRLSRKGQKRSYFEKLKELVLATRLEFRESKKSILKLYASHAPYGGNVVGLEMAAWRYFGLQPQQLSWAESATLAVLPNAPSLIYPGKNQQQLKQKRDYLLKKLFQKRIIDSVTYALAVDEALPQKPYPLPTTAHHLVQNLAKTHKGQRIKSTINRHVQQQVNALVKQYYSINKQNEVFNMAVLVLDVSTRKVIAYVGNSPTDAIHQNEVDNVISNRSTGSVLKPLLYAQMLNAGDLLPSQLIADIPTEIAGYIPKNYDGSFSGAIPANQALTRSLNIPAVRQLQRYGLEKFRDDLKSYHISGIKKSAGHYGLSLVLGGAEASLWDLCKTFAGMAGIVNDYETLGHKYYSNQFVTPILFENRKADFGTLKATSKTINASAAYATLNTLTEVNRPHTDQAWKFFESSKKIAWKTGTSFGNRDAWAIGATSKYVVGVWVGNSDGEGRPNLTGVGTASPLMFDVFNVLPNSKWFLEPFEDQIEENICDVTGYLALPICKSTVKRIPNQGVKAKSCPYHKEILLDKQQQYRVNTNCELVDRIVKKTWLELPPLMAFYYKRIHSDYKIIPEFKKGCVLEERRKMSFIFPTKYRTKITLTKDYTGKVNPVVLKLTHRNPEAKVYWYLDEVFLQETTNYHELAIAPKKGKYVITAIDNLGNEVKRIISLN